MDRRVLQWAIVVSLGGALAGCAASAASAHAKGTAGLAAHDPASDAASESLVIRQDVDLPAGSALVYDALLDSAQFSAFSGRAAEIDRTMGGVFSLFDGHIVGLNVELVPDRRIVQAWRVVTWPEGVYSIARFELSARGTGTHVSFEHTGFPAGLHDHLAEGWQDNYWSPLGKAFAATR